MPGQRHLQDDLQRTVIELFLVAGARHTPGIADDAIKLAPLDPEHEFLCAGIAGKQRQLGAEQDVERLGEDLLVAARSGRADLERGAVEHILE